MKNSTQSLRERASEILNQSSLKDLDSLQEGLTTINDIYIEQNEVFIFYEFVLKKTYIKTKFTSIINFLL